MDGVGRVGEEDIDGEAVGEAVTSAAATAAEAEGAACGDMPPRKSTAWGDQNLEQPPDQNLGDLPMREGDQIAADPVRRRAVFAEALVMDRRFRCWAAVGRVVGFGCRGCCPSMGLVWNHSSISGLGTCCKWGVGWVRVCT